MDFMLISSNTYFISYSRFNFQDVTRISSKGNNYSVNSSIKTISAMFLASVAEKLMK